MAKVPLKMILRECKRRGIRFGNEPKSFAEFANTASGKKVLEALKQIEEKGEFAGELADKLFRATYDNDKLIDRCLLMIDDAIKNGLNKEEVRKIVQPLENAKRRGKSMVNETSNFWGFYTQLLKAASKIK